MSQHEEMIVADGLQYEVRNYRKKNQYSWNWSCQVCGDSTTNQRKARFWVDAKNNSLVCHCFNCGYSAPFRMYVRDFHAHAYENLKRANVKENQPTLFDLDRIVNRCDSETLTKLFYIDQYPSHVNWTNQLRSKKIKLKKYNLEVLLNLHRKYHEVR
jgi:transcription elongation factor Elf1